MSEHRKSVPPFATLRAFEAVGTLRGVRRAALALNLDHAVISRHIRSLEEWAGVRLVERVRGNITLTDHGQRFHLRITAALREISEAAAELVGRSQEQQLQIWCVPGFASQWLAHHLANFQTTSPGVEIELHPTDLAPDFTRYEADIDIRYIPGVKCTSAAFVRAGMRRFEIARPNVYAVASPECATRLGPVHSPAALVDAPLLHEESDRQWRDWFAAHGVQVLGTIKGPRMWHADVAVEAARRGQGVALANAFLLGDDFATGRLVNVGPANFTVELGAYVFAARADSWYSPVVAGFRRWIKNMVNGVPGVVPPIATSEFTEDTSPDQNGAVAILAGASA